MEPYRADNARVVQENTKLHQQLLRLKESAESRMRDLKTVLRRLEHENADLKFLNTQYVTKMRSLERESEVKSERLLALHQKSCEAVIRTPGGKKRQVPLRRQRMEVDSLLHPSSATHMVRLNLGKCALTPHMASKTSLQSGLKAIGKCIIIGLM